MNEDHKRLAALMAEKRLAEKAEREGRQPPERNFRAPPWTPDMVAKLRELWPGELSCAFIAEEIGVTRNAVLGKSYRLGLPMRVGDGVKRKRKPRVYKPRPRTRRSSTPPKPLVQPEGQPVGLLDLKAGMCRYPMGDGMYCGEPTEKTFCMWHAARCYSK